MIQTVKHAPHEIAKLFPEMTPDEMRDLVADLKQNGLMEPIILLEDKVLDGRSRQQACVKAGVTPVYVRWDDLKPKLREIGPLAFAMSRNLKRRHLTPSQRAMFAAETLPAFEKEARDRQLAALKKGKESAPLDSKDANGERDGEVVRGKAAEQAAKAAGVSTASVERAKRVLKRSRKKAAAIKAGKLTVSKASTDEEKKAKAKTALEDALAKIEKTLGKDAPILGAIKRKTRLKRARDVIEFAALDKETMEKVHGLVMGPAWPLKRAIRFETRKNIGRNHFVRDLLDMAMAKGALKDWVTFSIDKFVVKIAYETVAK